MAPSPSLLSLAVVAAALASVLVLLARRGKSTAELLFAVFCASLAAAMLRPALAEGPAWVAWGLAVGACATCNAYWLVARALFRGDSGVQARHIGVAAGIAGLIVAYRVVAGQGHAGQSLEVLGALLTLASSAVLVLAFVEALRGWGPGFPFEEKRLRVAFMTVYGGCVLTGTVLGALKGADAAWATAYQAGVAVCALAILGLTHAALLLRRRRPWPAAPAASPVSDEDRALAVELRLLLEKQAIYRQTELKVVDLAQMLAVPEHRVSRAITHGLGERNFNQWVNRYRIAEACHLLVARPSRSVLEISADCGFASLGPFNRAFKAVTGTTPSAWRAQQRAAPQAEQAQAAAARSA